MDRVCAGRCVLRLLFRAAPTRSTVPWPRFLGGGGGLGGVHFWSTGKRALEIAEMECEKLGVLDGRGHAGDSLEASLHYTTQRVLELLRDLVTGALRKFVNVRFSLHRVCMKSITGRSDFGGLKWQSAACRWFCARSMSSG